ncbi:CocE/NonD family hydrolase [Rhodococcus wratislaviensis]|uniref:CocE/NonD family hydrolase n=1 Tax=Rhodococcus wratislaviensis TaxID=44752 RepID=UPI003659D9BA
MSTAGTASGTDKLSEMLIERDVAIPMRDGASLRANVYRPTDGNRCPVIVSAIPYGKDVHVRDAFPAVWQVLLEHYPEVLEASSGRHMIWECPDPEVWVHHGYAVVQMDVRGTGKSPGFLNPNSPAEVDDCCDAIAWAGEQPWSSGSVGLLGLGYITAANWQVAARKPPHLKAMIPCQGTYDFYRDRTHNDGIYSSGFTTMWWEGFGKNNQYGNPDCTLRDMYTGEINTGQPSLSEDELIRNRVDYPNEVLAHPLLDEWYHARTADLAAIDLPALVVANWGGLGLQSRGTINGWTGLSSPEKWLLVEDGSYFFTFFTPDRVALFRAFFDRYLKGIDNNWEMPRVSVSVRTMNGEAVVAEGANWPLPSTTAQTLHLDFDENLLSPSAPKRPTQVSYSPFEDAVVVSTAPLAEDLTIAGPLALRLWLSSESPDTDLFVTVQAFDPDGEEVTFLTAADPAAPLTQGWLRASQRELDLDRSTELAPVHVHVERKPLVPGEVHEVSVALWPTSLQLPAGSHLRVTIGGRDFARPEGDDKPRPVVVMSHDDPRDRPPHVFGGRVTLHSSAERTSVILLPVLPHSLGEDTSPTVREGADR